MAAVAAVVLGVVVEIAEVVKCWHCRKRTGRPVAVDFAAAVLTVRANQTVQSRAWKLKHRRAIHQVVAAAVAVVAVGQRDLHLIAAVAAAAVDRIGLCRPSSIQMHYC